MRRMTVYKLFGLVLLLLQLNSSKCTKDEFIGVNINGKEQYQFEDLKVNVGSKIFLDIIDNEKDFKTNLYGELGVNIPSKPEPIVHIDKTYLKVNWGPKLRLEINDSISSKCHKISWTSELNFPLKDCYEYGTANWFGGPEIEEQYWPIEQQTHEELPYVTQTDNMGKVENYWLNSNGVYIYVDPKTPLFIDSNNHRLGSLCLIANDIAPYLKRPKKILEYHICGFNDPREAQEHAVQNFLGKPSGIPDVRMIEHPIWSTWARYSSNINETIVLKYAKDIVRYGFNNSQIEIDDSWETCYGSSKFNLSRFPDMNQLSGQLKNLGFRVTVWVHPFVNLDCPDHDELAKKGYFVKSQDGDLNSFWWNGEGSGIDFTNQNAVQWFRERSLKLMTENGIDGIKFDAGETSYLPQIPNLNCSIEDHPNAYTTSYIDTVSQMSPLTEMRVAYRTQQQPIFVRMVDKDSRWTYYNGLPTLLSTMFVLNTLGYPWVLPDMVGGNAYNETVEKELFIRWLQANTFMPSIQFSIPPWDYDFETIEISRKVTELHYKYSGKIVELMKKTVRTGAPLNPPIWWIDPTNPIAHRCNSEYLLGEDILVAPILKRGAVRRNIYLPKGYWRDENHPNKTYKGRRWLRNYYADLHTLPYFTRVYKSTEGYKRSDIEEGYDSEIEEESETVFLSH